MPFLASQVVVYTSDTVGRQINFLKGGLVTQAQPNRAFSRVAIQAHRQQDGRGIA